MSATYEVRGSVAVITMDNPPVNALTVAGWFELADVVRSLGDDPAVRVVILAAEGRGYNAGVDIKEMQATEGFDALIGANKGCFAAFAAVYRFTAIAGMKRTIVHCAGESGLDAGTLQAAKGPATVLVVAGSASTAASNSNTLLNSSSVTGWGLAALKVAKKSSTCASVMGGLRIRVQPWRARSPPRSPRACAPGVRDR